MRPLRLALTGVFCTALLTASCSVPARAGVVSTPAMSGVRDGQHDFDFELGHWKIHLKRRVHPLSGSQQWAVLDGTTTTRKVWNGRANLEEFEVRGPTGPIEGMTLRLYNPQTRQWSLYWANSKAGVLGGPPNVGEFRNGVGEFYCYDTYNGRYVLIRYVWSRITPDSAHFEESFSDDGGRSWEVEWITDQTRSR